MYRAAAAAVETMPRGAMNDALAAKLWQVAEELVAKHL